jgi:hypothetical protein
MSHLLLVRHGQASFLEENYDKLSAKGEAQSRLLGKYWACLKLPIDRVFAGPRVHAAGPESLHGSNAANRLDGGKFGVQSLSFLWQPVHSCLV